MATPPDVDPASAALEGFFHSTENSYVARADQKGVPTSTLWHRAHGRKSMKQKAASQQYLTQEEEKALVSYLLRMCKNGYPLPVKFARSLAHVIVLRRNSIFQIPSNDDEILPPSKNWPQAFYKRHPELKAVRMKALDWERHDHQIYDKVVDWFTIIGKELANPAILAENIYNMDETGVLLSVLNSLKVLVGKDELRNYRGAAVKRTLITAIECISADGRFLHPLIVWPAATHRSNWTVHPTPGWHFAHSATGYTDTAISLHWIQHVFDPQTKARAKGKPRILINDGFGTHESLELITFCYENNIILCRLPSHTSHKLQPCDVGVFGSVKTAYRDEVERLHRGGSNMIGKQHFTLLYDRARSKAFSSRNIISGWSKTGLRPFNPDRVLKEIQKPEIQSLPISVEPVQFSSLPEVQLRTPTTSESLMSFRREIEDSITRGVLDDPCKLRIQKVANAAENAFADRAILLDENLLLFEQNNERRTRASTKSTVVGTARILSYEDIIEAQKKRDIKEAKIEAGRNRRSKRNQPIQATGKKSQAEELKEAEDEVMDSGLQEYCSVMSFSR